MRNKKLFLIGVIVFICLLIGLGIIYKKKADTENKRVAALKEKAAEVDKEIVSLNDIKLSDRDALSKLTDDYNALGDEGKSYLTHRDMLVSIQNKYKALLEQDNKDWADARTVDAMIEAIGDTISTDSQEDIFAAQDAYNALNETARSYVTLYDTLINDEAELIMAYQDEYHTTGYEDTDLKGPS